MGYAIRYLHSKTQSGIMAQHHIKILSCLLFIFLLSALPVSAAAVNQQWFPEPGSSCKYKLIADYDWLNGTRTIGSEFVIYKDITRYYLTPLMASYYNVAVPATWEYVGNASELFLIHSYVDKDATTLSRNTSISTTATNYGYIPFSIVFLHWASDSMHVDWDAMAKDVPKTNYFNTTTVFDFPDYVDSNKAPHWTVNNDFEVLVSTETQIVASKSVGNYENYTILADGSGKVTSYTFAIVEYLEGHLFTIRFESTTEPSLWDRIMNLDWAVASSLLGITLVVGIIIGVAVKKRKQK